jgi:hypothetical protein
MKLFVLIALGFGLLIQTSRGGETNLLISPTAESARRVRVVMLQNTHATLGFAVQSAVVRSMVTEGILKLTEKNNVTEAWRSLVSPQDVIGIKVFSTPGALSGTRPAVVSAVVQGLLEAGHSGRQIIIWDKYMSDLQAAGYVILASQLGVEIAASAQAGYDEKAFYENPLLGRLIWGDRDFGLTEVETTRKSYITRLLTRRITKIINIAPLLNHNRAGVSGLLYSLALGSVDNIIRFESSAGHLASAVPEIIALPDVGDRVVLNLVDALLCQYQGEQQGLLHYSTRLNQIRLSLDPVALDVLSLREIENQRRLAGMATGKANNELYDNAALLELGLSDERRILVDRIVTDNKK